MSASYDWFVTLAASLNDAKPGQPFRRYALRDLIAYFNDAMCLIAQHRPDLFTEFKTIKLQCGSLQDARDCCSTVTGAIAQTDVHGNVIKDLSENKQTDTKVRSLWNKPSCLSSGRTDPATGLPLDYVVDTVSIDNNLNGRFTVSPPVPPDKDIYLLVKCLAQPCRLTEEGVLTGAAQFPVDCGYLAATRFYVLAWALTGDRHSTSAQTEASRLYKMFFDLLQIAQVQELRYEEATA